MKTKLEKEVNKFNKLREKIINKTMKQVNSCYWGVYQQQINIDSIINDMLMYVGGKDKETVDKISNNLHKMQKDMLDLVIKINKEINKELKKKLK